MIVSVTRNSEPLNASGRMKIEKELSGSVEHQGSTIPCCQNRHESRRNATESISGREVTVILGKTGYPAPKLDIREGKYSSTISDTEDNSAAT